MRNSTNLFVEERFKEVEIAEAQDEVSSVVVLHCINFIKCYRNAEDSKLTVLQRRH